MELHKSDSRELFAELLQNNDPLEQRHVIDAVRQKLTSSSQKNKYTAKKQVSDQALTNCTIRFRFTSLRFDSIHTNTPPLTCFICSG